ncbi:class I SAM-dependent methyltransferase [Pelagibacterales bacterium SAG-MED01]|nr:class I SAM-dependent methyltransferase [Pelagibacterales bacterium SAG-MED01]
MNFSLKCKICNKSEIKLIKKFKKKNKGENLFGLENKKNYSRSLYACECGHYYNIHKYSKFLEKVYKKNYSNYSHKNIEKKFEKIRKNKKKSSNLKRVNFLEKKIKKNSQVLDVGSGFGIFPFEMVKCGFKMDCIESDRNMINFLKSKFLNLVSNDIKKIKKIKKKYDLITFNKVLEHFNLSEIKKILRLYKSLLKKDGKIYIEVPDSAACKDGYNRQEFFLEHYNIFSLKSLNMFLKKLKFKVVYLNSIYEINKKYTIRAIIK